MRGINGSSVPVLRSCDELERDKRRVSTSQLRQGRQARNSMPCPTPVDEKINGLQLYGSKEISGSTGARTAPKHSCRHSAVHEKSSYFTVLQQFGAQVLHVQRRSSDFERDEKNLFQQTYSSLSTKLRRKQCKVV